MPKNVLEIGPQVFAVVAGLIALLGGAFAFSFRYRTGAEAGRRGHRGDQGPGDAERATPDGFIDTFTGGFEEAGGGMPITAAIIIITVLVCYFAYLFLFWNPR